MDDKLVRAKVHTAVQQHCATSGVQPNPYLAQRVLAAAHEGRKGIVINKNKLILLIVLALILLSSTVALAWSLSREYFADIAQITLTSGDYENWSIEEKRYMMTIMGKYGLISEAEAEKRARQSEEEIDSFILERYAFESAPDDLGNISIDRIAWVEMGPYTGGVNIADEYINEVVKFGHWKDTGLRLEGEAVRELTRLFLLDYGLNVRKEPKIKQDYFPEYAAGGEGWLIPFGDGPVPVYQHQVGKSVIQNMLNQAQRYVWMMTPYLIIDSELCMSIENAARRGVDVRIIVPHIPDKKLILEMTRSYYARLMEAGVQVYEYEPGFIHAKCYLADDEIAMVGTINLDYRSLTHHFENGVWMYRAECIPTIKQDFTDTFSKSIHVEESMLKKGMLQRLICTLVKMFAPML